MIGADRSARALRRRSTTPAAPAPARALPRIQSRGVARGDDCIGQWRPPAPAGVAWRTCASEEGSVGAPQGALSTTKQRLARARFGASPLASGSGAEVPWRDRGGSPRAVLSPSSGQGVGGCGYSRGVPALPTSPSAGLRPIRRRPCGPSPDRASMLGRSGDSLNHKVNFLNVDRQQGRAVQLRQPGSQAEGEK
jgi:hypothetical protein